MAITPLTWLMRPAFQLLMKQMFSMEVFGREHLDNVPPQAIFAGNHTGFLDGPLLVAALDRPVRFLVAQEVLSWPYIGKLVSIAGIFPIAKRRERKALRQACDYLRQHKSLVIFPEGQLSRDGQLGPFRSGVVHLQKQTNAPIVPFVIHGGYEAWPWGQRFPKSRKIYLSFGPPIYRDNDSVSTQLTALRGIIAAMKTNLEHYEHYCIQNPASWEGISIDSAGIVRIQPNLPPENLSSSANRSI